MIAQTAKNELRLAAFAGAETLLETLPCAAEPDAAPEPRQFRQQDEALFRQLVLDHRHRLYRFIVKHIMTGGPRRSFNQTTPSGQVPQSFPRSSMGRLRCRNIRKRPSIPFFSALVSRCLHVRATFISESAAARRPASEGNSLVDNAPGLAAKPRRERKGTRPGEQRQRPG